MTRSGFAPGPPPSFSPGPQHSIVCTCQGSHVISNRTWEIETSREMWQCILGRNRLPAQRAGNVAAISTNDGSAWANLDQSVSSSPFADVRVASRPDSPNPESTFVDNRFPALGCRFLVTFTFTLQPVLSFHCNDEQTDDKQTITQRNRAKVIL